MRSVLIFKETLLPASETFILGQMQSLTGYRPVLAGLERAAPSLPVPEGTMLLSRRGARLADLRAKFYRRCRIAPLFHAEARRAHPDLIHAHFASGGRTALPLAQSLGVPLLVTLHGKDVTVGLRDPDRYRRLAESARAFICVSRFIRDRARAAGFPEEKLRLHYIGIDRDVFRPSPSPDQSKGVLFVGRLVEKKGCEYLLRAMQLVARRGVQCDLTIIGDGPLRPSLEALAGELNVQCTFLGVQPAPVVREALQRARLFCAPSVTAADGDSEGLGMVFAEAQAMGVPVVSTEHGGIPEVVLHGVTGLLVGERNHEDLASAIAILLQDENRWHRFRTAGMAHIAQHFDLAAQTRELERIYDEVVDGAHAGTVAGRHEPLVE